MKYEIDENLFSRLKKWNADLKQCICTHCNGIIVGPILFGPCEHGSCRSCFVEANFKKPIKGTVCLGCKKPITSAAASGLLQKVIDNLKIKCDQGRSSSLHLDSETYGSRPLYETSTTAKLLNTVRISLSSICSPHLVGEREMT